MSIHNILPKKIKKQLISINDSIESYFNELKFLIKNFRKFKLHTNNKAFLIGSIIFISTLAYFLMPTVYNKKTIQEKIENQILDKFNVKIEFKQKIKYGLFPKPHFYSNDLSIIQDKKKIAKVKKLRIYISSNKLLSINNVYVRDVILSGTDFNLNRDNINFIKNLLTTKPNADRFIIKKSNIFYKNFNDEMLFLNKIDNFKFFYDYKNLENVLVSKNEAFTIPFSIKVKNKRLSKELLFSLNARKLRLVMENKTDYNEEIKKGSVDVSFINKNTLIDYQLNKDSFILTSKDRYLSYDGKIDFKPFYFVANFDYDNLSFKNLFKDGSILSELIKSEILNNENLNMSLNLNVKNLLNINELNNLILRIGVSQGNIGLSNSKVMWNDEIEVTLKESYLNYDKEDIKLVGRAKIDFKKFDKFYSFFQVKKKNRKQIEKFEIDFVYNLTQKKINFDNPKIDNGTNKDVEKFIQNFNFENKKFMNKIVFKNFVNSLFAAYAG